VEEESHADWRGVDSGPITKNSAVDRARNDLSFVERNVTYRQEPLFRPDALRADLGDAVFGLAVGLIEAGAARHNEKSVTPSERFPWEKNFSADAGDRGTRSPWALQVDDSLPFVCHLRSEERLLKHSTAVVPNVAATRRIGMILTDLGKDALSLAFAPETSKLTTGTRRSR
jgi:hypothetical protein